MPSMVEFVPNMIKQRVQGMVDETCSEGCGECILDPEKSGRNNLDPVHQKNVASSLLRQAAGEWQCDREIQEKIMVMNEAAVKCDGNVMHIDWLEDGMERLSDDELRFNPDCISHPFYEHQPQNSMGWALDSIFWCYLACHTFHRETLFSYSKLTIKLGSEISMSRKAIARAHTECLQIFRGSRTHLDVDLMCEVINRIPELPHRAESSEFKEWNRALANEEYQMSDETRKPLP